MTVIRPNSISGITSLTAHRGSIDFYAHDGSAATFTNINSNVTSGVSTFASLNITGDLDVGGALTYEDVTNVDSIGVVTARSGIHVTGGNVGINKASPSRYLEIGGTSNNPQIRLSNGAGTSSLEVLGNAASGQEIRFGTEASPQAGRIIYHNIDNSLRYSNTGGERLRIDSSGRVLISDAATAGPMETFGSAVFQVATTAGGTLVLGRNDSSVSTDNGIGSIYFDVNDSSGNAWNETARITVNADGDHANNDYPSRMEFYTTGDGEATPTERLRITSAGAIGIGSNFTAIETTGGGGITLDSGSGGGNIGVFLKSTGYTGNQTKLWQDSANAVSYLESTERPLWIKAGDGAGDYIRMDVAGSEALRIISGGQVIIGDSASDLSGTHTFMACGAYHAFQRDGNTGTYLSIGLGAANGTVDLEADARSGGYPDMRFITNNDERLRITSGGDVCVGGHSSNYANSPLEVRGTNAGGDVAIRVTNNSTTSGTQAGIIFTTTTADYTTAGIGFERGTDDALKFYVGQSAGGGGFTNAYERLRIKSDGKIGINASSGWNAYGDVLLVQGNTGATAKSMISVRGGATGYVHSALKLSATTDNNGSGGNQRGLGVFMHDESSNVEWYAGRPYSQSDYFLIARNTGVNNANAGGVTAQHSMRKWQVDSSGRTVQTGGIYTYQPGHSGGKSSRAFEAKGASGTYSQCVIELDQHSYGSVAWDIKVGGYHSAHQHVAGTYYCNGALYANYTSINNSANVSYTRAFVSGQIVRHTFYYHNGFVHPTCEVTATVGGDGYFAPGDITITWS